MKARNISLSSSELHDNNNNGLTCLNCERILDLGVDLISVEKGVVGPRGVVPLGDAELFCSEGCLIEHFTDDTEQFQLKRRVP